VKTICPNSEAALSANSFVRIVLRSPIKMEETLGSLTSRFGGRATAKVPILTCPLSSNTIKIAFSSLIMDAENEYSPSVISSLNVFG